MRVLSFPRLLAARVGTAYAANPRRVRVAFFAVLAVVVLLMSAKYMAKIAKAGDDGRQLGVLVVPSRLVPLNLDSP